MRSSAERQGTLRRRLVAAAAATAGLGLLYSLLANQNNDGPQYADAAEPRGYYLSDTTLTEMGEDGRPRVVVHAQTVEQQRRDQSVLLSGLELDYQTEQSGPWTVTADHGHMPMDRGSLLLQGDVTVTGEVEQGEAIVQTDELTYDTQANLIHTENPVTVRLGTHSLQGKGLRVDLNAGTLRLESEVNGRFLP
jgi:LPS export ABC transporter protein LptC